MDNNKNLFELMTKMYADITNRMDSMQGDIKGVNKRLDNLENKVDNLENKVDNLETKVDNLENKVDNLETKVQHIDNKVNIIEQEHGKKLTALFDGYTQNAQKRDNIQEEVSKHEEVILKRIK